MAVIIGWIYLSRFSFAFAKSGQFSAFPLYDGKDLIDWPHLCHLYFGRAFTAMVWIWHMDPHRDSVIATLLSDAWFVSPFYRALKQRLWWSSFQQWFIFSQCKRREQQGKYKVNCLKDNLLIGRNYVYVCSGCALVALCTEIFYIAITIYCNSYPVNRKVM